ncbi:MAG: hypothetical protein PHP66_07590 [Syntrophales bacterium]|nr:hypothetical protein [Syntrophales bacterium]
MIKTERKYKCFVFGAMVALLSGVALSGTAWTAAQPDLPDRGVSRERPAAVQPDRTDRGVSRNRPSAAQPDYPDRRVFRDRPASPQPAHRSVNRQFRDSRYHHNRDYPARGHVIRSLPRDHRVIIHGGTRYYFSGGAWYRPRGSLFTVVVPPIGLFVPFLPPFYSTIWVGGVPYYYANEIYYAHQGNGYVIVDPPREEVSEAPPSSDQMFIYPRQGQSEQQQADDRYTCHRWAIEQTGFDPTQPYGSPESSQIEKRADYQRAMSACLDGRGYTVK